MVVLGVLAGVLVRSIALAIGTYAAFEDPLIAGVIPVSGLFGSVVGIITFAVLIRIPKVTDFFDSIVSEMYRITWPTREETLNNTTIVVGTTIFFATLLSVYDLTWARITGFFLFSGR